MRMSGKRRRSARWRPAIPSRLLSIIVVCWLGVAASVGLVLPRLGSTYALYTSQSIPKSGSYTALSGDTAFSVSPVPAVLGTYQAGSSVNSSTVVLTITNKTSGYTRKTNVDDLHVDLILDSAATLNVTVNCSKGNGGLNPAPCDNNNSYALKYGQSTRVTLSGTAGNTPGTLTGYFRITGLNDFLVLDVPITGAVTAPPGFARVELIRPVSRPVSDEATAGDPVITPVPQIPVVIPDTFAPVPIEAPAPVEAVPVDTPLTVSPAPAISDPVILPTEPPAAPADSSPVRRGRTVKPLPEISPPTSLPVRSVAP